MTILCDRFGRDQQVLSPLRVQPGALCYTADLAADAARPAGERALLALAQGCAHGDEDLAVRVQDLVRADDDAIRLFLDALAIARARELPVEWPRAQ